ncbi:hypothetical protein ACQ4PT_042492 [Festuca glaucescens]
MILDCFGGASGLKVNYTKSVALPIRCSTEVCEVAATALDCPIGSFPSKYLGLPLSLSKLHKQDVQPILDKLAKKLSFWRARLMSREGRVAYVRFIMTASLIYHLMALDLEPWLLRAIDKVRRGFLWVGKDDAQGGHCIVAWQAVCKPKYLGGLGLHNQRWLNAALRARWIWFQKTSLQRPWSGLQFSVCSEAHSLVTASTTIEVRNGSVVLFWEGPWIGRLSVASLAPALLGLVRPGLRRSRVLRDGLPNSAWVRDIAGVLTVDAVVQFLKLWGAIRAADIHLKAGDSDGFRWKWSADGQFTSRSAYHTFFAGQVALPGAAQLWHSFAPMKFRFHGWLAIWQRCWTADRLQRHGMPNHSICPLCNAAAETYDHLSLQCPFATAVWIAAFQLLGWHPPMPTATSSIRDWWPEAERATTTGNRKALNSLVLLVIRSLWLERNARVFDARASSAMDVSRWIADEWAAWGACRRRAVRG